jgi:hypothetical protein
MVDLSCRGSASQRREGIKEIQTLDLPITRRQGTRKAKVGWVGSAGQQKCSAISSDPPASWNLGHVIGQGRSPADGIGRRLHPAIRHSIGCQGKQRREGDQRATTSRYPQVVPVTRPSGSQPPRVRLGSRRLSGVLGWWALGPVDLSFGFVLRPAGPTRPSPLHVVTVVSGHVVPSGCRRAQPVPRRRSRRGVRWTRAMRLRLGRAHRLGGLVGARQPGQGR